MTILNDKQIAALVDVHNMIDPFISRQVREIGERRVISYGLSSYGYDARVADDFYICTDAGLLDGARPIIDPKDFDARVMVPESRRDDRGAVTLPPHSFTLARTVEYFHTPDDVMVVCLGKSTYARCGLIVNVTPLEPGWHGHVTLELSNTTPLPIKVYPCEGICQFLFFRGERPVTTYGDRGGKYQGQTHITLPRM